MTKHHTLCAVSMLVCGALYAPQASADLQAPANMGFGLSSERGFSYFLGLATQHTTYSERADTVRASSSASVRSALLVTGALYAVHPDLLLALDHTSNFAPGSSVETWRATSSTVPYLNTGNNTIEDRAVNGPLLQQNRFSLSQNVTRLTGHYRVKDDWFSLLGMQFHTQSFKRYAFHILQPNVVSTPSNSVVEESASEMVLEAGLALESERVKSAPSHYSLRATIGTPIWRRLDNTNAPDVRFDSAKGLDLNIEGRYSLALSQVAHIGGWAQYGFSQRASQIQGRYELPRAHVRTLSYGLELLWKL